MTSALRKIVRSRAGGRCEYCHLPESEAPQTFHVEHIIARQHGGQDRESNLALSCDRCNVHKGTNLTAIDPETQTIVPLFNPRQQKWHDHFRQRDFQIVGKTTVGRATVRLLNFNVPDRINVRRSLRLIL